MITLITAVPGSGKTLYTISLIQGFLDSNRHVYCNINGLSRDYFNNSPFLHGFIEDWRDTPDGSVIIYDEAQELFPAVGKSGVVTNPILTALETHRHSGHDLFFITQAPTLLHHHIRKLTGCHIHLYRPFGLRYSHVFRWNFCVLEPNDRKEQQRADSFIFRLDKKYFSAYQSTTIDTHKFVIPKKFYTFLFAIIAIFALVFYLAKDSFLFKASGPAPAPSSFVSLPAPAPNTTTAPVYSGCISFRDSCRCYDGSGNPLAISKNACLDIISRPVPFKIAPSSLTGA